MALAADRIAAERVRLERLGVIDADGELFSRVLPPDMLPESDTTLETGRRKMARPSMIVVAGPPSSVKTRSFPPTGAVSF